ncbi:LacI family DNA-binding transcriptional regulator [Halotalea alkalilenta]|uniref:LacI family DNA-binding transcriptional regulator n=1 Tax=Halotalea alkalilenta TaxID=376489 RepID=UPI00069501C3|nr:LacI family DNA-binding transcriptional regulator [Halotalea alkalilenta]
MAKQRTGERPRVTLNHLAARLKVSVTTVSNAFNRPDQLSTELRERVLAEAQLLGYDGPDAMARGLRTGKTHIIGVVLTEDLAYSFDDPIANRFLCGVAQVLDRHGHRLLLVPERSLHGTASEPMADGFVVYGVENDSSLVERLRQRGKPVVTVDFELPDTPSVRIEDRRAMGELSRWALANTPAHFEPVIVSLRLERWRSQGEDGKPKLELMQHVRLDSICSALQEAGHDPEKVAIFDVEHNTQRHAEAVLEAALQDRRPRLLLCMTDRIALGALTVAERLGLSVPGDIRIIGFDGLDEGQRRSPQLTTVYQDSQRKGELAACMVLGLDRAPRRTLAGWSIYGETCPPA